MTWFQKPPLGTPLDWSNPLNKDLAMHLAMNEGHGDVVRDLSLYGNHGTLSGFAHPPTVASGWNPGQTGIGLNLGGTNDYICFVGTESLNINEAFTFSAWVKGNSKVVFNKYFAGSICGGGYMATLWGSGSGDVCVGGTIYHTTPIVAVDSNRHHLAMTYTGEKLQSYLDGVPNGHNDTMSGNITSGFSGLYIGTKHYNSGFYTGSIDQPRVMNRTWSAKEILNYNINPWQVYLDEDD